MASRSKEYLKEQFENGKFPTEDDFADVIDSAINKQEEVDQVVPDAPAAGHVPSTQAVKGYVDGEVERKLSELNDLTQRVETIESLVSEGGTGGGTGDNTAVVTLINGIKNNIGNPDELETERKQLVPAINEVRRLAENNHGGNGGTTDYNVLVNKPKINGKELNGDMTPDQLGIDSQGVEIIDNLETQDGGKSLSARQGKVLKDLVDENGGRIETVMDEIDGINAVLNQINPDEATTNPVSINQLYYVFRKLKEVVRTLSNTAFTNGKPNISDWQIPNISEGDIGGDVGIYYDIARHLTNAIMGNTNSSVEAGKSFVSSFSFSGVYGKFGWFVKVLSGEDDVTADSVNYDSKTITVENVGDDIDVTINGGVQAKHTAKAAKGTNFTNFGTSEAPDYRIGGNNQLGGHIFAVKEDGDFDLTSIINGATMNSTTMSLLAGLTFFKIPEWAERIVAECSITGTGASGIRWSVYGFRQSEDGRSLYRNLATYNNERTKIVERSAFEGYNLMFIQFRRDADTNWYTSGDGIIPENFSKVGITFRFE